jgi:hypothetical protein
MAKVARETPEMADKKGTTGGWQLVEAGRSRLKYGYVSNQFDQGKDDP